MLPKILFVEDDEVIREIYAMKFELEGFPVAVAENGAVALDVVKKFQPQVILLDMMMPVMDGLEFMRRLKTNGPIQAEVIVFSNVSMPDQMAAVKKLGASDYWVKSDYTPERVATEISKRWDRHLEAGPGPSPSAATD
jgi:CheY-like chemotaxis protein